MRRQNFSTRVLGVVQCERNGHVPAPAVKGGKAGGGLRVGGRRTEVGLSSTCADAPACAGTFSSRAPTTRGRWTSPVAPDSPQA
eukprot:5859623-Prymnesium_polylepis.3